MSEPTITQRDVRRLTEGKDLVGTLHGEVKAFGDRMPHGEALRSKARDAEAKLADAEAAVDSVLKQIERTGDVRM